MRTFPLAIGIVDLESGEVAAISDMALEFGSLGAEEVLEQPVLDRIHPDDRAGTAAALGAMATGSVDLFRSRPLALSDERSRFVLTWVRRLDIDDRRIALFELGEELDGGSPLGAHLGHEPSEMAVGLLDESGVVTQLSTSISRVLGIDADAFIGRELLGWVEQHDVDHVLEAMRLGRRSQAAGVHVLLRSGDGTWQPSRLILTALRGSCQALVFILIKESGKPEQQAARVADLEHRLWKIAGEIEAAGLVTRVAAVSETRRPEGGGTLTTRQWEVLGRLLRGERVPTIAEDLFLSQSTVRGHVATILKRYGVHSQPELLKLLRSDASPS